MTPQEARELVNREQELHEAKMPAWNAWRNKDDESAMRAYLIALGKWVIANNALTQARLDYPHLFAQFVEVTG